MRSTDEVRVLLDRLDHECADDLEGQDLDFKQWDIGSMRAAVAKVVEAVVCMANGGGGTVVLGVADRIVGRSQAILGVPAGVDAPTLRGAIHERTDPRLIPEIHELAVPEGSGRLLVVRSILVDHRTRTVAVARTYALVRTANRSLGAPLHVS